MSARKIAGLVAGAILAVTTAYASETTVVTDVLRPEGPLYIDGNLYYVGWISNTLSRWDGKKSTVLNHTDGCGHNGLALTKQKTFMLACADEHGAILELDMTGRQLRRWEVDSKGNIYVAQWPGAKILKLSPEGKLLHVFDVAAGNGTTNVAFGPGESDLYVTVAKDPDDPQARGSIVRIPNVK